MAKMQVDTKLIRELADMLNETDLTEIEVEDGDLKIKLSRGGKAVHVAHAPMAAAPAASIFFRFSTSVQRFDAPTIIGFFSSMPR